jgi:hypothetical protein
MVFTRLGKCQQHSTVRSNDRGYAKTFVAVVTGFEQIVEFRRLCLHGNSCKKQEAA